MVDSTTHEPAGGCLDTETIVACCDAGGAPFPAAVIDHVETCDACRRAVAAAVLAQRSQPAHRGRPTPGFVGPWLAQDTVADRYRLERVVGIGGMGIVCLATDLRLERPVALKVLRSGAELDVRMTARLQHESRMMARLRHPNVITVFDVGEHHGHTYVAMEYVPGSTLRAWLDAAPRTTEEILDAFRMAGRGLAAAHGVGVIHRDFKPDNVLVGDDARVQVTDFGLAESSHVEAPATAQPTSDADQTAPRSPAGTPAYMAPEQFDGGSIDARTDVFAFCVALWEALGGALPFPGRTPAQLREAMARPPVWGSGGAKVPGAQVPGAIRRTLARGLAIDPASRPPTMDALLHALDSRPRRYGWGVALLGASAIAISSFDDDSTCPELDDADRAWRGTHAMLADRTDPEAPVDAAVLAQAERYHSSWRSGLSEWCGTTASPEDRAAVHRCLQDARVELDAMLERAREASSDASTVLMAMDRLPAVEMCVAADARAWPRPADPQLGAAVDRLRDAMVRARARHVLGQHTRARADLDALQTDAALAFDAARAELLLAVAETTVDGADPEAGPAQLREAIAAAMSAGHDAVVIRAWIAMARATIQTGTDPARGDEYLGYAEAALDRLGRPAGLVAAVALARGEAAQLQGRAPEARAALGEAVTGSSPGSSTRLDALHALANLEASVGAVEAAVAVHDELLTQRRARFGDPSMPVARSLLALGSAYGRLGRWQESADAAGRVAEIVEALLGTGHWWVALALHNRADALRHLGRVEEALAVQRRALAIAEVAVSAESPTMARIRRGEATIRRDAGDLAGATAALVEQCDAVERRLGVHLDVADCWVDLAATHLAGGRLDDGLVTITRAVSIYGATLGPDAEPLGRARSIAGQILRRRGDLDRAVTELSAAITILEQTDPDPGWLGHTLAELERARGADGQPSSREARQRAVTLLESADPLWAAQRASAQGLLAG